MPQVKSVDFDETVEYLYALQKFGTKLGLENTRALLELLGNPERKPRFLHVTGTNGKGSVSAFAASALQAAGIRTGLYTSPHLVSFTERIRLDGVAVSEAGMVAFAGKLRALVSDRLPEMRPTFFEFTTAMALDWFAGNGADVVVLEVGMGGRLDSTNVVMPECCVITNVDVEHTEYLGGTIAEIAREKAGIIKHGVPLVTSEQKPEVIKYIEGVCREADAPMYLMGRDYACTPKGFEWRDGSVVQRFDYSGPHGDMKGLETSLVGAHQLINAATAACALGVMAGRGIAVDEDAVRRGFKAARWEGRLEVVSERPLLVLDGAHNPASAARLADAVKVYFAGRYKRLLLVAGVMADKDVDGTLGPLIGLADKVVITRAEYDRSADTDALVSYAAGHGSDAVVKATVSEALSWAMSEAGPDDMVLVAGSLYVVGEAKAALSDKALFLRA